MVAQSLNKTPQPVALRRILVVVDPTAQQQPALDKAALLAARSGSSLELHVCDVDDQTPDSWAGGSRMEEYRELRRQRQLQEFDRLAAPLRASAMRVDTSWQWHAPLERGIGHHVIRSQPDLVIKATHRHPALPRGAASHTDWNLIRLLPAPLLLVHAKPWPDALKVAAAVDPGHPADRPALLDAAVLEQARALAGISGGALDVFHVLQTPPHLPGEAVPPESRAMANARARDAVGQLAHGSKVNFVEGALVEGLLQLLAVHRPDVLVMGAVARPRSAHSPAGGTAAQILERADCDLLVVKSPGFVSPLLVTDG